MEPTMQRMPILKRDESAVIGSELSYSLNLLQSIPINEPLQMKLSSISPRKNGYYNLSWKVDLLPKERACIGISLHDAYTHMFSFEEISVELHIEPDKTKELLKFYRESLLQNIGVKDMPEDWLPSYIARDIRHVIPFGWRDEPQEGDWPLLPFHRDRHGQISSSWLYCEDEHSHNWYITDSAGPANHIWLSEPRIIHHPDNYRDMALEERELAEEGSYWSYPPKHLPNPTDDQKDFLKSISRAVIPRIKHVPSELYSEMNEQEFKAEKYGLERVLYFLNRVYGLGSPEHRPITEEDIQSSVVWKLFNFPRNLCATFSSRYPFR